MNRIKMFIAYTSLAWMSLINPKLAARTAKRAFSDLADEYARIKEGTSTLSSPTRAAIKNLYEQAQGRA